MKGKKILSAVLSAAMLISCITVGSGSVVQASGESRTVGNNIARNLQIVAYSGEDDRGLRPIGNVNDGVKTNDNDHRRWQSKEDLKGSASHGNAAYIIFDLGDENDVNSVRSFSQIKVKFHNLAYATDYKILTSDTCEIATEAQLPKATIPNGWTELIHKQHTGTLSAYPEDVLDGRTDSVGRYLMFFFTAMNSSAGAHSVSVREIEIYNNPVTGVTMSQESANLTVNGTLALTATVNPADATQTAVQWSTDNADVATVDQNGNVTAVAPGTATITATSKDNKSKNASCTVTVQVDKTRLSYLIDEAKKLQAENYEATAWEEFQATVTEAETVRDDVSATEKMVSDAVLALNDALIAVENHRVYKVTVVNGETSESAVVDSGAYGKYVTVTAPKASEGKVFAGWKNGEVTVSTKESYSFYLVGDVTLTATYQDAGQEVVQEPGAMLSNVLFKETTTGKYRVSFVCQLSVPEGYELEEAGIFWSKTSLDSLHSVDGNAVSGARKVNAKSTNRQYQYTININNVPSGFTLYQEVFAKVKNTETGAYSWVYTTVKPVTVP